MRQAAIALLAVPVLAAIYVGEVLRRSIVARASLALGLALVLGIGVTGAGRPSTTLATPVNPILPLAQTAFTTTFSTDRGLTDPVTIEFTTPMDSRSVAASLTVQPPTLVTLAWDPSGTVLTVRPKARWAVGTFHTVTVQAGALARSGQPLTSPARAAFLTRRLSTVDVSATEPRGGRVAISTSFLVSFATPVDSTSVTAGIRLEPATPGTVESSDAPRGPKEYRFVPSAPLLPDVAYRLVVSGVRDLDGLTLDSVSLAVRTTQEPAVVRFRPQAGTLAVPNGSAISVRFTEAMDRSSTAKAFSVTAAGKRIVGTVRWAETDTVLIFTPPVALQGGATIAMDVGLGATSVNGVHLGLLAHGTFQTVSAAAPPKPKAVVVAPARPAPARPASSAPSSGGSAVGSGSWGAVETYYLGLMNCTRTGGWVTSTGACSSPGGRNVAALKLDSGISTKVSRPYAKRIAISGDCSHFIGGTPGDRLRRAGYTSYRWAENLGCRSGDARAAVLGSHLFFQAEKSYNGGHYVNLMNAMYDRVGIGVWVSSGRVRLVIDFYHP
ncbi:MAG: Ig-like domain-containing protein [Chloroflexota bacterium]